MDFESDSVCVKHKSRADIMQINYCKSGQMNWKMENGNSIHLNPGDFSLHTMKAPADSVITFPTGRYSGLTVYIDLHETALPSCEDMKIIDSCKKKLEEKFCINGTVSFIAGNEQTESIFSAFYDQPEYLKFPYQKLKVSELLFYLSKIDFAPENRLSTYQHEQVEIIRKIHDRLTENMEERITIDELSKQYLLNSTTLKSAFKAVYGTSIAAHIREHRMKQAALLLQESVMSIAQIAQALGYDSQSKFTAAFKAYYQILPTAYRKQHRDNKIPADSKDE